MNKGKIFYGELVLMPVGNGLSAKLIQSLAFMWKNRPYIIPKGFETDYASVPRLFWRTFPPHLWPYASCLHDWLYASEQFERAECDLIFHEALIECGASKTRAWLMYQAVRRFGWITWLRHDKGDVNDWRELAGLPPKYKEDMA